MSNIVDFILVTGIILTLIAIIGLIKVKKKTLPQYILGVIWLAILDVLLFFYAVLRDINVLEFITYYVQDGVRFLIPPLVYVYIKSIFLEKRNLIRANLFHFIPFLLYLCGYTIPSSLRLELFHIELIQDHIELALEKDLYGIFYFVISLRLFYNMRKALKNNYSKIGEKDFLWIEKFLYSFLLVLVIDLLITLSELLFAYDVFWDSYITAIALVTAIGYLGYYGLTQSTIFLPDFLIENHLRNPDITKTKPSVIANDQKNVLMATYTRIMKDEKRYLSSDISLRELAQEMELPERKLSAFFREVLKSNFYDSVNAFRVAEAKVLLKSDAVELHSITGIGLSCGFKSKSSFYRIFKKHMGMTPLKYAKQQ